MIGQFQHEPWDFRNPLENGSLLRILDSQIPARSSERRLTKRTLGGDDVGAWVRYFLNNHEASAAYSTENQERQET